VTYTNGNTGGVGVKEIKFHAPHVHCPWRENSQQTNTSRTKDQRKLNFLRQRRFQSLTLSDLLTFSDFTSKINYYAHLFESISQVYGWNPSVWSFKWKLQSSTFMWFHYFCSASYLTVLSSGAVCFSIYCKWFFFSFNFDLQHPRK